MFQWPHMKLFLTLGLSLILATQLASATDIADRLDSAYGVLRKKQGSLSPIPQALLDHAYGIAFATVTKGGIGIGGVGGEGIVMIHRHGIAPYNWSAPSAFNIAGGSLGAQLGFSKIRYIILLNTAAAVKQFAGSGKVKWDATAMGTAGSNTAVERESTVELSRNAVVIYSDSGGIFGGATFGGTTIETKDAVNHDTYGEHVYVRDIFAGKVHMPDEAKRLIALLDGKH